MLQRATHRSRPLDRRSIHGSPRAFVGGALAVVLLGAGMTPTGERHGNAHSRSRGEHARDEPRAEHRCHVGAHVRVLYLWWSTQHWHDKLGASISDGLGLSELI